MLSIKFKSQPFLLLLILALFCLTFFSLSNGFPEIQRPPGPTTQIPEKLFSDGENGVVSMETRSFHFEGNGGDHSGNSSVVLAAKRTHRKDPLDNFKYYRGGWNISEKHYFSSVAFTAAPLFVIAAMWCLGFGLCIFVMCLRHCCCLHQSYGYSKIAYAMSLIFLILFTITSIIGCIVVYTGQGKFHPSTTSTLEFVVSQADVTVKRLRNVSGNLLAAKGIGVDQISLPWNVLNKIDRIDGEIDSAATTLEDETRKNSNDINSVLSALKVSLIVVAAVMLLLACLGFLTSFFGMQRVVYILVVIGWILVAVTFILCGILLVLHNVVGDTCVAMEEWVQRPASRAALDDILPCIDNETAQDTLYQSKDVTFQLVAIVNTFISNVSNRNFPPQATRFYYNQSGPLVPLLCNPYNSDKTDRSCAATEVNFINAAEEWNKYLCQVSETGNCTTVGRLTPTYYGQIVAAANVSHALYRYGPQLVALGDCTFVRETLSTIHKDRCPSLRRFSNWIYVGLVIVSVAVMLSLISWLLYARERRHRLFTKYVVPVSAQGPSAQLKARN